MKKVITTALAFILTLGMSVTAFAAVSPSADVTVGTATLADGSTLSADEIDVVKLDSATTAVAQEKAKELVGANSQVLKAYDVKVPIEVSASNPISIPFTISDVMEGTALVALHQKADGTWEKLDCTWKGSEVWVTFTSLSPVVFATVDTASGSSDSQSGSTDSSAASSASTGVTSPKTADAGMNVLAFTALFCGAALICVNRKRA
ncbi:MAG: hypothetical protein J6K53_08435 [Roseburia sp.]|nr:hypothetical protein [Roseburia sp.]